MGLTTGVRPARLVASIAFSMRCGLILQDVLDVPVPLLHGDLDADVRIRVPRLRGDVAQEALLGLETRGLEVTQVDDEGGSFDLDRPSARVDEALAPLGRLRQHVGRQTRHIVGKREHRVHQETLGCPRMRIPAGERDRRRSSVPRLVVDDAEAVPVDGVGERGPEAIDVERRDA